MRQECVDEVKNPSESHFGIQQEKASSLWTGIEAEESLVPMANAPVATLGFGKVKAKAKGSGDKVVVTPSSKGKPGKTTAPLVWAAKQKAKTAKDFAETERVLERAHESARRILDEVAPKVIPNPEDLAQDPSLELLRSRLNLVSLALNRSEGADIPAANSSLYEASMNDPYLKDLQMTVFADKAAVQTLGSMYRLRRVLLDLYLRTII